MHQREIDLVNHSGRFLKVSFIVMALLAAGVVRAAQAPNPRTSGVGAASARGDAQRAGTSELSDTKNTVSRAATRRTNAAQATRAQSNISRAAVSGRSVTSGRSGVRATTGTVIPASVGRAASSNVVRAATSQSSTRGGTATANVSRAATARATAVFDDVSKIGGGYATCREAYATCMDQFCAKANDTYRRCFCSAKFTEFRDTEAALDQAKTLLMRFEDTNLNAVDKTAAEVNAMYTATVGEAAIKKDTSAAQAALNEIGDLLSGKKKATASNVSESLGLINVDFSADMDDIWSGGGNSIFSTSTQDLSSLEGQKLFDSANAACLKAVEESCDNNAVLTMARSSYGIMITQDCNAYEKKINSQREAVANTVRQAEKMLRDARLDEYRAHNSADVNECLDKVKTAITQETACGANYKKCLDYSGVYIDVNGEPIYSPRLFKLTEQIILDGSADVVGANPSFSKFLDDKKMFATTALDSCRDLSDIVWTEFKRNAIIEIAQAQDAKIEEVKMSCVSTMSECYSTQSGALKSSDNTTAQYSGAMAASAARDMCADKVTACAALYGDTDGCVIDTRTGRVAAATGKTCGLQSLLSFVDTVDNVRVAEGCQTALENKLKDMCTPATGDMGYPWKCRLMVETDLQTTINGWAAQYCGADYQSNAETVATVRKIMTDVKEELDYQLRDVCEDSYGYWFSADHAKYNSYTKDNLLGTFYSTVFAGDTNRTGLGKCVVNSKMVQCEAYGADMAKYDTVRDECVFEDEWYAMQCTRLDGYYENGICYIPQ
ncbi:hypothetical protein HDR61_02930 [bacterium]|nr:hypothetical protein [bacterium]